MGSYQPLQGEHQQDGQESECASVSFIQDGVGGRGSGGPDDVGEPAAREGDEDGSSSKAPQRQQQQQQQHHQPPPYPNSRPQPHHARPHHSRVPRFSNYLHISEDGQGGTQSGRMRSGSMERGITGTFHVNTDAPPLLGRFATAREQAEAPTVLLRGPDIDVDLFLYGRKKAKIVVIQAPPNEYGRLLVRVHQGNDLARASQCYVPGNSTPSSSNTPAAPTTSNNDSRPTQFDLTLSQSHRGRGIIAISPKFSGPITGSFTLSNRLRNEATCVVADYTRTRWTVFGEDSDDVNDAYDLQGEGSLRATQATSHGTGSDGNPLYPPPLDGADAKTEAAGGSLLRPESSAAQPSDYNLVMYERQSSITFIDDVTALERKSEASEGGALGASSSPPKRSPGPVIKSGSSSQNLRSRYEVCFINDAVSHEYDEALARLTRAETARKRQIRKWRITAVAVPATTLLLSYFLDGHLEAEGAILVFSAILAVIFGGLLNFIMWTELRSEINYVPAAGTTTTAAAWNDAPSEIVLR